MALSSEFRQNQGSFWQMYRYPRILSHSTLLFIRCFLAIDLLPIRIYNLICARFFFRTERFFLYEMDNFQLEKFGLEAKKEWGLEYLHILSFYTCTLKTVNVILDISLRSKGVKAERIFFCFYLYQRQFNYSGEPIWRQTVNFQSLFFGWGVRVAFTQRPPFLFFSLFPPCTFEL